MLEDRLSETPRQQIKELTHNPRRVSKPQLSNKNVQSRFSPSYRPANLKAFFIVLPDATMEEALEFTFTHDVTLEIEGNKYLISGGGKNAVEAARKIIEEELAKERAVILTQYRSRPQYLSSRPATVSPATSPLSPSINKVFVTDEETMEKALELAAEGPVRLTTFNHSYILKGEDAFDRVGQITSDQLSHNHITMVERYDPGVDYYIPSKAQTLTTIPAHLSISELPPSPPYSSTIPAPTKELVYVKGNEEDFNRALDLLSGGPVDVYTAESSFNNLRDFDTVAELLVDLLNQGKSPVVIRSKGE
jgi:hypothetical protein